MVTSTGPATSFDPDICQRQSSRDTLIIRARTPMRISFAGGGTDLPSWFTAHDGATLCGTITRYARVTVYPRDDKQVRIRAVNLGYMISYAIDTDPIYDGMLDLAKAAIQRLGCTTGLDVDIHCDAPPGSGLGGSSALVSSVIGAVAAYQGRRLDLYELAELNYLVERQDLKIPGGMQDQYATTFGGFNLIEFSAQRVVVNPLRLSEQAVADLEAHLMMCDLGMVRTDAGLITKQIQYAQDGRPGAIEGTARLKALAYEMKVALLRSDLHVFGELLHEAFISKKMMNPDITQGTKAEELYACAREHGAIGGKLMGAGGGGFLLLYCATHRQHDVRRALELAGGVTSPVTFESRGLHVWATRHP